MVRKNTQRPHLAEYRNAGVPPAGPRLRGGVIRLSAPAALPAEALAISVGNTHTAALVWAANGIFAPPQAVLPTAKLAARPERTLAFLLKAARAREGTAVILGGVAPEALRAAQNVLRRNKQRRLWRFRKNLPCPLKIVPRPAKQVGDDRLAGALGALALDAKRPWVVVDAGTALTVNAVRPAQGKRRAIFEGGWIVPGEGLALKALAERTAQLPIVRPWPARKKTPAIGRSTQTAMQAGVRRAQLAAAVELARAQAQVLGARTRVLFTGGGAPALWSVAQKSLRGFRPALFPELVPFGLLAAWMTARK